VQFHNTKISHKTEMVILFVHDANPVTDLVRCK